MYGQSQFIHQQIYAKCLQIEEIPGVLTVNRVKPKEMSEKQTTLFFIRIRWFWLSISFLIVFPNFRLICPYFVLVTIIIFDLALENGLFEGKMVYFNSRNLWISRFIYWWNHRLCCSWRFWWHRPIYCKVSTELVHSVNSLLICVLSFNWFDLFLTLEVFLGPCIQPGHCL